MNTPTVIVIFVSVTPFNKHIRESNVNDEY